MTLVCMSCLWLGQAFTGFLSLVVWTLEPTSLIGRSVLEFLSVVMSPSDSGSFLLCAPVPFVGLSLMHLSPQPVPRILVQPTFSDARATRTEEVSHQVGAVPVAEVALTLAFVHTYLSPFASHFDN